MALPSSGQISFSQMQTELGGSNPISMTEYRGIGTVPSSGAVSASHFRGVTKPSGSVTFTSSGSWTCPNGVTSVTVCMIGGGGGGGQRTNHAFNDRCGGGRAGQIKTHSSTVVPGRSYTVTCGAGGKSRAWHAGGPNGLRGGTTTFNGVSCSGGAGGTVHGTNGWVSYQGNGAWDSTTCYGRYKHGALNYQSGYGWYMWGGEAGFANGGAGTRPGSRGSGAGGGNRNDSSATNGYCQGGRGVVKLSWG